MTRRVLEAWGEDFGEARLGLGRLDCLSIGVFGSEARLLQLKEERATEERTGD